MIAMTVRGKDYQPTATYSMAPSEDKKADSFLATDCIGTEKLVSSTYNTEVFVWRSRCEKTLADIQMKSRTMRRCFINIKRSTTWHSGWGITPAEFSAGIYNAVVSGMIKHFVDFGWQMYNLYISCKT